jgi:hypothetical protein
MYFLNLAIFMPNRADEFSPYEQAPIGFRVDDLPGAEQYSPRELLFSRRPDSSTHRLIDESARVAVSAVNDRRATRAD